MMLQNKLDRAMDWLKEQNQTKDKMVDQDLGHYDPRQEWLMEEEENISLEKYDFLAIFLSSFIVFGPIIIILIIIFILVM